MITIGTRVMILPTFTSESALAGESARVIRVESDGEIRAVLVGRSPYIHNETDGYVILSPGEFAVQCWQCEMTDGDHSRFCAN